MNRRRDFLDRFQSSAYKRRALGMGAVVLFVGSVFASVHAGMAPPTPDPVVVTQRRDIDFGSAAGDGSLTGTVVLDANTGAKTVTGGVIDFGGQDGLAQFKITGDKNADVFVVLPTSATITIGGTNMTINNFTMNATNPINLGNKGSVTLDIGATLQVGAGQAAGSYTGTFTVSADY